MSKYIDLLAALVLGLVIGWFCGCDYGQRNVEPQPVKFVPVPVNDTLKVDHWRVEYRDSGRIDTVPVVQIQTQIETLLVHERVKQYTVCADTVLNRDSLRICYNYVGQTFTIGATWAERDGVVMAAPRSFVTSAPYLEASVGLDRDVFIGGGIDARVFGVSVFGRTGLMLSPLQATAQVGLRYVLQ